MLSLLFDLTLWSTSVKKKHREESCSKPIWSTVMLTVYSEKKRTVNSKKNQRYLYNGHDKEYSLILQAVAGWFYYPFTLSSWKASNDC